MRQKLLPLSLTSGFLALLILCANAYAVDIGQPAPPLVIKELDGQTFDLAALKGKVVIIHFWATWCASCKEEMPVLDAYYKKYHDQGFDMIAVSADKARRKNDVVDAMKDFSFPAALISSSETNGFGTPSDIPVTYIVGKSGVIQAILSPEQATLNGKILESAVGPLLAR